MQFLANIFSRMAGARLELDFRGVDLPWDWDLGLSTSLAVDAYGINTKYVTF